MCITKRLSMFLLTILLAVATTSLADDWPQFRGPNRDGTSTETGLLKKWPQSGPKLLWSVDGLGIGFSSAAIADGLVYTPILIGAFHSADITRTAPACRLAWPP